MHRKATVPGIIKVLEQARDQNYRINTMAVEWIFNIVLQVEEPQAILIMTLLERVAFKGEPAFKRYFCEEIRPAVWNAFIKVLQSHDIKNWNKVESMLATGLLNCRAAGFKLYSLRFLDADFVRGRNNGQFSVLGYLVRHAPERFIPWLWEWGINTIEFLSERNKQGVPRAFEYMQSYNWSPCVNRMGEIDTLFQLCDSEGNNFPMWLIQNHPDFDLTLYFFGDLALGGKLDFCARNKAGKNLVDVLVDYLRHPGYIPSMIDKNKYRLLKIAREMRLLSREQELFVEGFFSGLLHRMFPDIRPDHLCIVQDHGASDDLETGKLMDLFPSLISCLNILEEPFRVEWSKDAKPLPENTLMIIVWHGCVGIFSSGKTLYSVDDVQKAIHRTLLQAGEQTVLPARIILNTCMSGSRSLTECDSMASQFADVWHRATGRAVAVTGYDGILNGEVLTEFSVSEKESKDTVRKPSCAEVTVTLSARQVTTRRIRMRENINYRYAGVHPRASI